MRGCLSDDFSNGAEFKSNSDSFVYFFDLTENVMPICYQINTDDLFVIFCGQIDFAKALLVF